MRRLVGPVLGLLLGGGMAAPVMAQRSGIPPIVLEEPRPGPVFPAAIVPFTISSDLCKKGHVPRVSLKVYNVAALPVATLRIRGRQNVMLDTLALHCGEHVAFWDGTIDGGTHVASPAIYWLQLEVDNLKKTNKFIVTQP